MMGLFLSISFSFVKFACSHLSGVVLLNAFLAGLIVFLASRAAHRPDPVGFPGGKRRRVRAAVACATLSNVPGVHRLEPISVVVLAVIMGVASIQAR
jgi:hypothetical protein